MSRLFVLVGVPAAGKSTWVKDQKWAKDCSYVSTDMWVEMEAERQGKTYSEVFAEYMPHALQLMTNQVLLAREKRMDIIWDQTSTTVSTRAKKINMLPDYYKIAVVFKTPPTSELKRRLESRPGKNIPWEIVSDMAQKLEDEPPSEEEGFDEIWYN